MVAAEGPAQGQRMARSIDYGNLMHQAMRGLMRKVLGDVAERGLPGNHHFFITFDTNAAGVKLADWLHDRYPGDMTIVLQHWFTGLTVEDEGFAVTLNFGNQPEPLYIPFDAIRTFVDPSVEFGLRFETHEVEDGEDGDDDGPEPARRPPRWSASTGSARTTAEVPPALPPPSRDGRVPAGARRSAAAGRPAGALPCRHQRPKRRAHP